jgi:hypothetical protein
MSPPVQVPDSQRLRERAVECRSLAELFRARAARNHLLEIAADYDHLSMKAAALELVDADRQGTSISDTLRSTSRPPLASPPTPADRTRAGDDMGGA